ncbi:MAG: DIP1984 family protein [Acidobacteria bacterium]|nr:DIP1984 family protein [Acidobacteriota bacterium]
MKLAESLILRADCQKRFEQLKVRVLRSAKVQEGDAPPENPQELVVELEGTAAELSDLIKRINRTNSNTQFDAGRSLSDALAERDVLALRRAAYSALAEAAAVTQNLYSRSEVKFVSTVNVAEVQRQTDALAKEYRELDARIQETNWQTDLREV